jgi:hypothetical protein
LILTYEAHHSQDLRPVLDGKGDLAKELFPATAIPDLQNESLYIDLGATYYF